MLKKRIKLRNAVLTDIPFLNQIKDRLFTEDHAETELNKKNFAHLIDGKNSQVIVVKYIAYESKDGTTQLKDNRVIGFSIVKKHPEGLPEDRFVYVTQMAISDEFNGVSVAKGMLDKVERECRRDNIGTVFARSSKHSALAERVFKEQNYTPVSYPPEYYSDGRISEDDRFFKKEIPLPSA